MSTAQLEIHKELVDHHWWDWSFWWRWVGANAIGEMIGLGIVAATAMLLASKDAPDIGWRLTEAAIIALAGIAEGVAVGIAQWRVLRWRLPELSASRWTIATAAGAFVAWIIGMIPSTVMGGDSPAGTMPSRTLVILMAAGMGVALGPILGIPQWLALRRHLPRAGWWIAANCAGWALGMPIIFLGVGVIARNDFSYAVNIALGALLCAIAGAAVGAVHGAALLRLLTLPEER
jgi:NhaP-type Na+/H+ or K+/H+ antiporter